MSTSHHDKHLIAANNNDASSHASSTSTSSPNGSSKRKLSSDDDSEEKGDKKAKAQTRPPPSRRSLRGASPSPEPEVAEEWTISDSEALYNIRGWGAPYFSVNSKGHIEVDPTGVDPDVHNIDLHDLVEDVIQRGHNLPLIIRFSDILKDRIKLLNEAFRTAIAENGYGGVFKGVFPIKVCQQRRVVKEIIKYGKPYQYGLEAGSKPELLIVLAHLRTKGALITCNGYKDSEYVETALLAQQLGQTPIIVIEKLHELDLVIQAAKKLNIKPNIGVRAKLSARGVGRWSHSTGDHAKFGLSSADIMEVVRMLRLEGMLESLQLLHFHIGSQISRIAVVKDALREATQFFVELYKLGAKMTYLDVGGGLGVDYDGSKTAFSASMNYTILEYAADVVVAIKAACDKNKVPHPVIVTESGRAVCSHHSVLVFPVLGATKPMLATAAAKPGAVSSSTATASSSSSSSTAASSSSSSSGSLSPTSVAAASPAPPPSAPLPATASSSSSRGVSEVKSDGKTEAKTPMNASSILLAGGSAAAAAALAAAQKKKNAPAPLVKPTREEHSLIQNLYEIIGSVKLKNLQEVYHDALQYKSEALTLFTLGLITLEERAKIEELFWRCCMAILPLSKRLKYIPEELQELEKMMAYIYYCNISIFQSAPDTWAIDQLFPIIPIHRLDEKPTALATLADITCDSDGKIDKFISSGQNDHKDLLELHELDEENSYYLGMFLNGAYQEVLGNLHNLFGDTNVIHVELDPEDPKGYSVEHHVKGDTTDEVLRFMQYNPEVMIEDIRLQSEQAFKAKQLTLTQYKMLVKHYEKALGKYTYLWADED